MPPSPQSEDRPHQFLSSEQTLGNTQNQTQIPHDDPGWQWQGALPGLKLPERRTGKRRNTMSKPSAAALWEIQAAARARTPQTGVEMGAGR